MIPSQKRITYWICLKIVTLFFSLSPYPLLPTNFEHFVIYWTLSLSHTLFLLYYIYNRHNESIFDYSNKHLVYVLEINFV